MELKNFIETAKTIEEGKEIWLSDKTFNDLVGETEEIRINEAGYLELRHGKIRIQISMKGKLCSETDGTSYAEVISIAEHASYTGFKAKDIFLRPKKAKAAKIL